MDIAIEDSIELNERNVMEFLILGKVWLGNTIFKGVKNLDYSEFIYIADNQIHVKSKNIGDVSRKSQFDGFKSFFDSLAFSISNLRSTISLTGGYDSRLIYSCLHNELNIATFMSGDDMTNPDFVQAALVSKAGGDEIEFVKTLKPDLTEEYLQELLYLSDAAQEFLNVDFMRIIMFLKDRKKKGFDLYISGDGGVKHKDWYWLQDWPFYKKKRTNIKKFFKHRIEMIKHDFPLHSTKLHYRQYIEQEIINSLVPITKKTNTESYDSYGFQVLGYQNKIVYNNYSKLITSYSPLWELELVRYSYNLPRKLRVRNLSIKIATTNASRSIARIKTVYGPSSSSEIKYRIRDYFLWYIDYARKFFRLMSRKFLKRAIFISNPTNWNIEKDLRQLPIINEVINYAEEKQYIEVGIDKEKIPIIFLSRLVQIYLVDRVVHNNISQ
jgi:hypothetical protein